MYVGNLSCGCVFVTRYSGTNYCKLTAVFLPGRALSPREIRKLVLSIINLFPAPRVVSVFRAGTRAHKIHGGCRLVGLLRRKSENQMQLELPSQHEKETKHIE
jgi:hypothetical protein